MNNGSVELIAVLIVMTLLFVGGCVATGIFLWVERRERKQKSENNGA